MSHFRLDLRPFAIRYFGAQSEVIVPKDIERLDDGCFHQVDWVSSVAFDLFPKLLCIGCEAFMFCKNLKSIAIPFSVTFLGDRCFAFCRSLQSVSFCAGSTLNSIPDWAFYFCDALESIVLPSTVKTIGTKCFWNCKRLSNSPLSADSQIVRIEGRAFVYCSSLKSMFLSASLEFVGAFCFAGCASLSSFTFGSPAHLRELLHIPSRLSGFVSIPDSIEIFSVCDTAPRSVPLVLSFGIESKLNEIRTRAKKPHGRSLIQHRTFLQFSSRSLKKFRVRMEFESDN
jgi:hypothetical protein